MVLSHKARPALRIGCSGWQYKHWRGGFYPADLPTSRWFDHYARTFDTVEVNNSFYRLPSPETFARWRAAAPPGFLYAVKASRFLTHMKKLKDPATPLDLFFEGARHLGETLGPVLYQLPPRWPLNPDRLRQFLEALDAIQGPAAGVQGAARLPVRHVMEFRDPTWYDERALALLRAHDVALCLHDMAGSATGTIGGSPFVYVRFHGATKYAGRYEDERLDAWADWLSARWRDGCDVFAYFNNDVGGHAPRDAIRLRERMLLRL
jgi:uncharacterized protein YecE (DUF72 family)